MKNFIFIAITIGMFTMGCNAFMIAGLLPQVSHTLNQSISVAGQGIALFGLFYCLSAPLFPILFSIKSLKYSIQIALSIFLLGSLITLTSKSTVLFLIGRSLTGVGNGIFTPLCITTAIHLGDLSRKGKMLGLVWGSNSAGAVFGAPFGLYLSSLFNWQTSIGFICILCLVTFIGFSLKEINIKNHIMPSIRDRLHLLSNPKIISVIGITCLVSMICLGLYSYIASIRSGPSNILALTLFIWGLGGLIGSSLVGVIIDLTKKPQVIMLLILAGLILTFITMPLTKNLLYIGLIPIFMWGAFGWATTAPQQKRLFELQENQETLLAGLNASAIGLGSAIGTAIIGIIIACGFNEANLPFLAATLLLIVFFCQLMILK